MFKYDGIASAVFLMGLIDFFFIFIGRGEGGAPPSPTTDWPAWRAVALQAPRVEILEHDRS